MYYINKTKLQNIFMFLITRATPFFIPLIIIINFSILFYYPKSIIYIIPINILLIILGTHLLLNKRYQPNQTRKNIKQILNFLTLPLIFTISTNAFLVFINEKFLYFFIVVISAIFIFLYFETNLLYLYYPSKYLINSKENTSQYIIILNNFFLFSSLYGFLIFLNIKIWILILIATIISMLLIDFSEWHNKVKPENLLWNILISGLIIAEFFYVISFLPSNIYLNGIIITSIFYLIDKFNISKSKGELNKTLIIKQSLFIIIILSILLATARWT